MCRTEVPPLVLQWWD